MSAQADARVVKRYAGALFEVARKQQRLEDVSIGLKAVTERFKLSPRLMLVLLHPNISRDTKVSLIRRAFDGQVKDDVLHLLLLMERKGRTSQIRFISVEFDRLVRAYQGRANGEVASAVPLKDEQVNSLVQQLHEITGLKVDLQKRVDEDLLGGLVVRVGDHMIDNSVAYRLNQVEKQLKQVKVV